MTEKKSYAGIDYFRLIAALLIVAIHTSPLVPLVQLAILCSHELLLVLLFLSSL